MTKTQKFFVIGLTALLVGSGIGCYIYYKNKKKNENNNQSNKSNSSVAVPKYNARNAYELQKKKFVGYGKVNTQSSSLRLRNSKNSSDDKNIITLIPKGALVNILEHDAKDKWIPICYSDKQSLSYYGYVDKTYIKEISKEELNKELDKLKF